MNRKIITFILLCLMGGTASLECRVTGRPTRGRRRKPASKRPAAPKKTETPPKKPSKSEQREEAIHAIAKKEEPARQPVVEPKPEPKPEPKQPETPAGPTISAEDVAVIKRITTAATPYEVLGIPADSDASTAQDSYDVLSAKYSSDAAKTLGIAEDEVAKVQKGLTDALASIKEKEPVGPTVSEDDQKEITRITTSTSAYAILGLKEGESASAAQTAYDTLSTKYSAANAPEIGISAAQAGAIASDLRSALDRIVTQQAAAAQRAQAAEEKAKAAEGKPEAKGFTAGAKAQLSKTANYVKTAAEEFLSRLDCNNEAKVFQIRVPGWSKLPPELQEWAELTIVYNVGFTRYGPIYQALPSLSVKDNSMKASRAVTEIAKEISNIKDPVLKEIATAWAVRMTPAEVYTLVLAGSVITAVRQKDKWVLPIDFLFLTKRLLGTRRPVDGKPESQWPLYRAEDIKEVVPQKLRPIFDALKIKGKPLFDYIFAFVDFVADSTNLVFPGEWYYQADKYYGKLSQQQALERLIAILVHAVGIDIPVAKKQFAKTEAGKVLVDAYTAAKGFKAKTKAYKAMMSKLSKFRYYAQQPVMNPKTKKVEWVELKGKPDYTLLEIVGRRFAEMLIFSPVGTALMGKASVLEKLITAGAKALGIPEDALSQEVTGNKGLPKPDKAVESPFKTSVPLDTDDSDTNANTVEVEPAPTEAELEAAGDIAAPADAGDYPPAGGSVKVKTD